MQLTHRKTCRVCNSQALTKVIDLGEQYLQGSFVKPGKQMPPTSKYPTSLVLCNPAKDKNACGLLQMEFTVPPEVLYSVYWYRSGTNNTMRNHLQSIAKETTSIISKTQAKVLDIGCNDGTLLNYYPNTFEKFGIDPSDIASNVHENITAIRDFFPSEKLIKFVTSKKFDIITSIAMFYDLENPIAFAKAVKELLSPDGIWLLEMSYMPTMLNMNSYDTICHEHLEYYSLSVIEYILNQAGLKIFNVSQNDINGGSLRCYVTRLDNSTYDEKRSIETILLMKQKEIELKLSTDSPYKEFQERIELHRRDLNSLLQKLKSEGNKIHIYGASTKGNTILQWCGIDKSIIEVASERSPEKYGASTLGTNIPIVSEEESRAMNPDYYLVLPWHFKKEFIERERETINKGIGFIFPLPVIEIIKK